MKRRSFRRGLSSLARLYSLARGSPGGRAADFDSGVYVPINDEVLFEVNGARAVANGNVMFSFDHAEFDGEVDAEAVSSFGASLELHGALALEVRAEASGHFLGSVPIGLVPLPSFAFGDVVVSPFASGSASFSGRAEASGTVSVLAPFQAGAEFGVPDQPVVLLEIPRFVPEFGTPEVAAGIDINVDVEASVVFMVAINGVSIGGPPCRARSASIWRWMRCPCPVTTRSRARSCAGAGRSCPKAPRRAWRSWRQLDARRHAAYRAGVRAGHGCTTSTTARRLAASCWSR